MLVGDVVLLIAFCLYKQIMAIVMAPSFPGWLAPLHFDPVRFEELVGFIVTVAGTWVACSTLLGDYRNSSQSVLSFSCCDRDCDVQHATLLEGFTWWCKHADMQQALTRACKTWLASMPIIAAQLVIATAAENGSLVMDERFAQHLPLVRSPGLWNRP